MFIPCPKSIPDFRVLDLLTIKPNAKCLFEKEVIALVDFFSVIYSVTPDSGPSQISVVIDTTSTNAVSRAWNIRIHQYECTSPSLGTYYLFTLFQN